MTDRPLTERQEAILLELLSSGAKSANRIALALGFNNAPSQGGIGGGRGSGAGTGPAQRVIGSLNGLKGRGLVTGSHEFHLTSEGMAEAGRLRATER